MNSELCFCKTPNLREERTGEKVESELYWMSTESFVTSSEVFGYDRFLLRKFTEIAHLPLAQRPPPSTGRKPGYSLPNLPLHVTFRIEAMSAGLVYCCFAWYEMNSRWTRAHQVYPSEVFLYFTWGRRGACWKLGAKPDLKVSKKKEECLVKC